MLEFLCSRVKGMGAGETKETCDFPFLCLSMTDKMGCFTVLCLSAHALLGMFFINMSSLYRLLPHLFGLCYPGCCGTMIVLGVSDTHDTGKPTLYEGSAGCRLACTFQYSKAPVSSCPSFHSSDSSRSHRQII